MAEITNSDAVIKKIQEFDQYLDQSMELLRSLRGIKEDVEKQSLLFAQKSEQLSQYEKNLSTLLDKVQIASQEIDQILSPIRKEKDELQSLDKRITERLAEQDATIRSTIDQGLKVQGELIRQEVVKLNRTQTEFHQRADDFFKSFLKYSNKELEKHRDAQQAFQTKIGEGIEANRKEMESRIADFLYKQNALVVNLSQQIDSYQRLTESLKSALDMQSRQIVHLESQNSEHRQAVESVERDLTQQSEEFDTKLKELREDHILNLEKETSQLKSALNDLSTKLSNIKFKKLLGL
jgi:chromosome segregation ATPase